MNKYYLLLTSFVSLSFAEPTVEVDRQISRYQEMGTITDVSEKRIVDRFGYLNVKSNESMDRFKHLKPTKKIEDSAFTRMLDNSLKNFSDSDYLTRNEFSDLVRTVKEAKVKVDKHLKSDFIIYLTSESVPNYAYMNILLGVGILQENGIPIKTKQYLVGPPKDFKGFMFDKRDYLGKMTKKEQKYIAKNYTLKLDQRWFEDYGVKKVPVILYGVCKSLNPTKETCSIKLKMEGDVSLLRFFEKASEIEPKYSLYRDYLMHNKIYKKQQEQSNE